MDFQLFNTVLSAMAVVGAYLIVKPQQVENAAIHKSIDNNTNAVKELTTLINDMRTQQAGQESDIQNLWHRYDDLKSDISRINQSIPICRREDGQCLKK